MIEIPYKDLDPETLRNLLREIVLREGTDYGETAISTEEKVTQLQTALETNRAVIMFNDELGFCDVVPK